MEKYLLLFRNSTASEESYQTMSPEEMQANLDQWNKWIGGIAAQGKLVGGEALKNSGKVINGSKNVVTDGPYVESKELVSGYLMVQVENQEEAISLSTGCPIYDIEGSVEVRPIMSMNQ